MNSKNNRNNHDFQIAYFLAGSCHTADAAYSLLRDLEEDRKTAIDAFEASKLRTKAKQVRARAKMELENEADRLEGEADLVEIEAFAENLKKNYAAAVAELATIRLCIEKLQPHRKYGKLSDPEAHEAIQKEEWLLELMSRAENCLLTMGSIPVDQFTTMRMHPDFNKIIWPKIATMQAMLAKGEHQLLIDSALGPEKFDLPKLLELK